MTSESEGAARKVLQIVADATFVLRAQSRLIRRIRQVKQTQTGLEFFRSAGSPILSGYVDAEIEDGTTISWLVDLTWTDSSWIVESELAKSEAGEQHSLQKLSAINVQTLDQLGERLLEALSVLLALRPGSLEAPEAS